MTRFGLRLFCGALLAVGVCAGQVSAQVDGPNSSDSQVGQSPTPQEGEHPSEEPKGGPPLDTRFIVWPVMMIPGVTELAGMSGTGIVYGTGLSEASGSVKTTTSPDPTGSISVAQPFIGMFQSGYRHKMLLEYSPTIEVFNRDRVDGSVLQDAGLRFYYDLSRKWRWVFSGYGSDGTQYLRELDSFGTGYFPGGLSFTRPTDSVLYVFARTGLFWHFAPRHVVSFMAGNTYRSIQHVGNYDGTLARVQLDNSFAHRSYWFLYGQLNRFTGEPGCNLLGTGLGVAWTPAPRSTLAAEVGPEHGNRDCAIRNAASFNGYLQQGLTSTLRLYLSASRNLTDPYNNASMWTDTFSTKLGQRIGQQKDLALGASYLMTSNLPGRDVPRYRTFLLFSQFTWGLSDSLDFVTSFRYYKHDTYRFQQSFLDRNSWVLVSLVWHPMRKGMLRTAHR